MAKKPAHQWQQGHCNKGNNTIVMTASVRRYLSFVWMRTLREYLLAIDRWQLGIPVNTRFPIFNFL
jgi:hypothetical protein